MICFRGHSHPPDPVVGATGNPTYPWGPRPYHCKECPQVNKIGVISSNWQDYKNIKQALKNHPHPCKICFPGAF